MTLEYKKIFIQAFDLSWKNKFLWIFGLFLSLGIAFLIIYSQTDVLAGQVNYLLVVVSILVFVLLLRFTTALILSVKARLDKQTVNIYRVFRSGGLFFWRLLNIWLIIYAGLIVLEIILTTPIFSLLDQNLVNRAKILAIFALIILVPTILISLIVSFFAVLFTIFFDLKVKDSITKAFDLTLKYLYSLVFILILLAILHLPALFLVRFMLGFKGSLPLLLLLGAVFIVWETVILVVQQTVWVLVFLHLVKPQKLEDEKIVPVPEPI